MPAGEEETGPESKPSRWVRQRESCLLRRNSEEARDTGLRQLIFPRKAADQNLEQTGLEERRPGGP